MWRFDCNEVLQREACGFGNFQNYRLRVKVIVYRLTR